MKQSAVRWHLSSLEQQSSERLQHLPCKHPEQRCKIQRQIYQEKERHALGIYLVFGISFISSQSSRT
jgi:hypothetical protein